ncbi:hypothetical protein GGI04_000755 [Coemansia thaxteri]|uniref:CobW/HypB/UreG nucleotide-binding domain-containing protein n=1 Tax=Coemansia thaxteri TaxID=2663907 RepID=A0A9W8BN86_9FUNG|nr:hypothetical protein H4R26_000734 [Coemansia thaxteri]KAJ2009066.1 hypothetical protein GGI04_000755 [Coemansia thaxteri]KAJ2473419.1 hypothetical protein GGI02_000870 [Coemansia sp. RSA 2322]KAJ2485902.1 hypothetical protein EV174_001444 [Coemansia sp. RSA 2320]
MSENIPELIEDVPDLVPPPQPELSSPDQHGPSCDDNKIVPATILTGYLGSGKTTLLNYILTEEHGKRIAVIMNEFGDSQGIDQAFTSVNDGEMVEEWLDLKNGCLCCTVKDKGLKAIESLMERKGKFDYILLETTGLADPGKIASMLWSNEELGSDIRLDGIVTMVDAKNVEQQLAEHPPSGETMNEAQKQLAFADRILLNKTDLVGQDLLPAIESLIRSINGTAQVEKTAYAKVDLGAILNIGAYTDVDIGSPPFSRDVNSHHHIDARIRTLALSAPHRLRWPLVDAWIQELLWDSRVPGDESCAHASGGMEVLRLKALLLTAEFVPVGSSDEPSESATVVVQGVREMYDSFVVADKGPPQQEETAVGLVGLYKLVLIGREMPEQALRSSWTQLLLTAQSELQ